MAEWRSGYRAVGTLQSITPDRSLAMSWQGSGEPGPTTIKVALAPSAGGATRVTLTHSGFGAGKAWAGRAEEAEHAWNKALDNLKSILETGIDPRAAEWPVMGVVFTDEPGVQGAVLNIVVPGGAAETAGLHKGDVVVRLASARVSSAREGVAALSMLRAGQKAPVTVLSEGVRRTIPLVLGARPVTEIPSDMADLIDQAAQMHREVMGRLRQAVTGLDETRAAMPPAECEWSVKQVLGHLISCEAGFRAWACDVLMGRTTSWIEARLPEQMAAVFAAASTMPALLDRLESEMAQSRALVGAMSPEHCAYKPNYRRLGEMLLDFASHTGDHMDQIENTIEAVKVR